MCGGALLLVSLESKILLVERVWLVLDITKRLLKIRDLVTSKG